MKSRLLFIPVIACLIAEAHADLRTSQNYSIATETTDSGGSRGTSGAGGNYTNSGSISTVTGIASITSPAEVAKAGYIGQLFDVTDLQLNSASPTNTVNEGATLQLAAFQLLDDATFLAVPAASVAWSVVSGPLTGINASGLATADLVYREAFATAQGIFGGFPPKTLTLRVEDVDCDNYREYAGDGICDDWQVLYFGLPPNPLAGPAVDFDGTGQTNLFKYIAGLNPLDGSRFTLTLAPVPGQPAQRNIIFTPRLTDRSYAVTFKTDLNAATWTPLPGGIVNDNGQQRTVTDPSASGAKKFYHIEITKP